MNTLNLQSKSILLSDWKDPSKCFLLEFNQDELLTSIYSIEGKIGAMGSGCYITLFSKQDIFFAYFSDQCAANATYLDYNNRLFCVVGDKVYNAYCDKNKFRLKRRSLIFKEFQINDHFYRYYDYIWKNFFSMLTQDYGGLLEQDMIQSFYNIYVRNKYCKKAIKI